MTRALSIAAFILGAIIVLWMGTSFMGSNLLAFIVTAVIAVVYIIGFVELTSFQRDTETLNSALNNTDNKVTALDDWLAQLAPSLCGSVCLRIKGEHVPLPLPMLTPYLVGLLVMLGLLGTFAGMVDTLKGAVAALEGTTELEAIRAGLAAPIKGLGTAFGTSVAGISASAMLGFIATLSRRRRALASRLLDSKMNTSFQEFSLSYNREQTFNAMQEQAQSLPIVAEKLALVADSLTHFSNDISQQLLDNQKQFTNDINHSYTELANSVEQSLQASIKDSSRLLGEQIQPLISDMVTTVNNDMKTTQTHLSNTVGNQLEKISDHFEIATKNVNQHSSEATEKVLSHMNTNTEQWYSQQQQQDQQRLEKWQQAFDNTTTQVQHSLEKISTETQTNARTMQDEMQRLLASTESLVEQRINNEATWLSTYESRMAEINTTLAEQLHRLRDEEKQRGNNAVAQLENLQSHVTDHLQTLGTALEAPMTRLIKTASETPKAAAEVISQLRAELANTTERDNQLLEEREHIFAQLHKVSDALQQSSSQQSENLQQLTNTSAETLNSISTRFSEQMLQESTRLSGAVDHFTSSATELASLGDAFGIAVEQFSQSNHEINTTLATIEASLHNNTERSDEQMAYYVAQAREIIDHTILSQQEVIEQLRQLGRNASTSERG